jgi:predicted molibdopterin-dependent oxidoreductase YjgC
VPLYAQMDFANLTAPVSLARKTEHYIYEGMSFTADVREGVQWPTLAENSAARVPFRAVQPAAIGDTADGITMVAARLLYDDSRLLAEAEVVQPHIHRPKIMLSRPDAEKLGVSGGDTVTVSQNGTSLALPVQVNRMLSEGVALVPRNLEGRPAEKLMGGNGVFTTVKVEKS